MVKGSLRTALVIGAVSVLTPIYGSPVSAVVTNRNVEVVATIGYGATEPAFQVSGTNETFAVSAAISGVPNTSGLPKWNTYYITKVKIRIGGQVVEEWTPPEGTTVVNKAFTVKWDTTEFISECPLVETGIICEVEVGLERWAKAPAPANSVLVEGPATESVMAQCAVRIRNWGFVGEIAEFQNEVSPAVTAAYLAMNYAVPQLYLGSVPPASLEDCLFAAATDTAYYFLGHGGIAVDENGANVPMFGDSDSWSVYDMPHQGYEYSNTDNLQQRLQEAALGGVPPMNFVFLDCCHLGEIGDLARCFLVLAHPYPGQSVYIDCAYMGWKGASMTRWSRQFTPSLYESLVGKATVGDAAVEAWRQFMEYLDDHPDPEVGSRSFSDHLVVLGDSFTRMHGLYNGQGGDAPGNWYVVD